MLFTKHLTAILASIFLIACSTGFSKQTDHHQRLNHTWLVVSIRGELIQIDQENEGMEQPSLEINTTEMKYMGSDGCNRFMGNLIEVDAEQLKFGISAGTRRMCVEMQIPDQFNESLTQVCTYKVKKNVLQLFSADGELLMKLKKHKIS